MGTVLEREGQILRSLPPLAEVFLSNLTHSCFRSNRRSTPSAFIIVTSVIGDNNNPDIHPDYRI